MAAASTISYAGHVAYIHGDVAADGTTPSGSADAYDQMLLTDSDPRGLSSFSSLVLGQSHTISEHYDQSTTLNSSFLSAVDVIVFGLHQKRWTTQEKNALDVWLRAGGGILIYSDSASGGRFSTVGAQNPVGQTAVNNLIAPYGMQVTVDQANGIKAYRTGPAIVHPLMAGRPVLEGEGVSPIAIASDATGGSVINLIPYRNSPDNTVSGNAQIPHQQNLTINNPAFSALALKAVGQGNIIAMFDRQPMWNNGPGSDIDKRDNREILRRVINYLATSVISGPPPSAGPANKVLSGTLFLLLD